MTAGPQSPMRVLAYADSGIRSGAENLFAEVLAGVARDPAFDLSFAAPAANRDLASLLEDATGARAVADVPLQPLPLAALHLYNPRRRRVVDRALAGTDPDVVLLNLPSPEYGSTALTSRSLGDTPIVGLVHITGSMEDLDFRLGGTRARLARRVLRRLDRACVLSPSAARHFTSEWETRDRDPAVIRMPRPEISLTTREAARRELGLDPDRPLIGIAGRLTTRQKGHDTLVAASEEVLLACPDARFVVAGEGQDRGTLEKMVARRGLERSWQFLGQVSPIGSFLSAIDAIAIPSRFEGLPLIALEALEAGVPGVATSVDGLADVWPGHWQVGPDDAGALARKLVEVLGDSPDQLQPLIDEGRGLMAERVTSDASADVRRVLGEVADRA